MITRKYNVSLTEILIAVAIMALVLIPIMKVTSKTVKGTVKSENNMLAFMLAKKMIADAKMHALSSEDALDESRKPVAGNGRHPFFKWYLDDENGITQENCPDLYNLINKYSFEAEIKLNPANTKIGDAREVTAKIYWQEDGEKYVEMTGVLR